jgi:hypothetical protein
MTGRNSITVVPGMRRKPRRGGGASHPRRAPAHHLPRGHPPPGRRPARVQAPADYRNPHQLALEHVAEIIERDRERQRLQRGLMIAILGSPALAWRKATIRVAQFWGRTVVFLLRVIGGTRVEFRGLENIPKGQNCATRIVALRQASAGLPRIAIRPVAT